MEPRNELLDLHSTLSESDYSESDTEDMIENFDDLDSDDGLDTPDLDNSRTTEENVATLPTEKDGHPSKEWLTVVDVVRMY